MALRCVISITNENSIFHASEFLPITMLMVGGLASAATLYLRFNAWREMLSTLLNSMVFAYTFFPLTGGSLSNWDN